MFVPGITYLLNIPQGWIIVGKATDTETALGCTVFSHCLYIERIGDGHSSVGSLPCAETVEQFKKAALKYYPVRQPMHIQDSAVTFFLPCKLDSSKLF